MRPTQEKLWLRWHVPVRCHTVKVHRRWAQQSAQVAAINPTAFSRCQEPGCQEAFLVPLYFSQIKRLFRRHVFEKEHLGFLNIYLFLFVCMYVCMYICHTCMGAHPGQRFRFPWASDSFGTGIAGYYELSNTNAENRTPGFNHQGHLCSSGHT